MSTIHCALLALAPVILSVSSIAAAEPGGSKKQPPEFIRGEIRHAFYDGQGNDLLTGGLGKSGLQSAIPPGFTDPLNPTAAELRTRAIHTNYRALVDTTPGGGFGTLYGPNVDANGVATGGEGKIAGDEYLAYADDGTGRQNVTLMVQVPVSFDPSNACIVTATSSGSRGIYGAIGTAGEWGLKNGCAVAYTDKGTGNGAHELSTNQVTLIDGTRVDADAAGTDSQFTANLTAEERAAFNAAFPNRWAFKHAHSQQNPEKDWGRNTLQAIEFAFWVLNRKHPDLADEGLHGKRRLKPKNTVVIASSVSNGAGAALAAAEEDREGWIDGVAVAEPQIQPRALPGRVVVKRGGVPVAGQGKNLLDLFTIANLYQPCARLATPDAPGAAFVNTALATNRCASLSAKGLLDGATTAEQAIEALGKLRAAGWEAETDPLQASHYAFATPAIAVTYAYAYGRFSVQDDLCRFGFAATGTDFAPIVLGGAAAAQVFANGNGIPPTVGINIVNNASLFGPALDAASVSPSTGLADLNIDGALCLRDLVGGLDANAARVRRGIAQVRARGNLRGKPAIIVHGRADTLVPVNHSSRPYVALNSLLEGRRSRLSYVEVEHAQHFDAFIGNALLAGYDTRFVPLHRYFNQAMDLMYAHLKSGAPLPPSQVVRTTPRGGVAGAAPALTAANVPPISLAPAGANLITAEAGTVDVPD